MRVCGKWTEKCLVKEINKLGSVSEGNKGRIEVMYIVCSGHEGRKEGKKTRNIIRNEGVCGRWIMKE